MTVDAVRPTPVALRSVLTVVALVAGAAVSTGCETGGGARAAAERFLDAHYVRIDLETARGLCSGLARSKLDKEISLTEEIRIADDTLTPRVNYRLEAARESQGSAQFGYILTIRAPGLEPFDKLVTLTVRESDGAWSVTNYTESDRADRASGP